MAQQRFTELRVGIFVVICLALVAGLILKFGKYERLATKTYQITVVFANVGGIVKDASVLYGGIAVGKVRDITLDEEGMLKIYVKLDIYQTVKIRSDARFVINQSGLLGDRYVDVVPQGATNAFLEAGATVQGSASADLTEAIHGVAEVLHQASGTIERVDKAIQRIDETVLSRQSLDHIDASLVNLDVASSNAVGLTLSLRNIVDENRGKVDNTLTRFSDAADNLSKTASNVDQLVSANQDDIRAAMKNLAESTARVNDILARLEKGEGTVGKLLVDPTLHDEIVHLVQNWRKYGLLYKEGNRPTPKTIEEPRRGTVPQPARPVQSGGGTLIFGTDSTPPSR
ncbi:MAG TPA: MlaD family protein [Verrucomicrobiae bacterium]|nr:MlaD family protein [Verrucomicrobiae bacterium]